MSPARLVPAPRAARRPDRRLRVLLAALVAVVLPLSACSNSEPDGGSGASGESLTIRGKFGEASIHGRPARVLPLTPQDTDFVLGSGVVPIAVPTYPDTTLATGGSGIWPWQSQALGDPAPPRLELTEDSGVLAEQIAELHPDVIVATGLWSLDQQTYDKLGAIAPVVHFDTMANGEPWQDSQRKVGRALGHEDEAEKSITDAEAHLEHAHAENKRVEGKTFNAVIGDMNNQLYVLSSPDRGIGPVLTGLGLKLDPDVRSLRTDADGRGLLGYEEIPRLDADVVFVISPAGDTGYLTGRPVWAQTAAARDGHVVSLPRTSGIPSAAGFPSPLSVSWVADQLTPLIGQALG